jgi:2-methylcitrate dehydratase PrpD
VRIVTRDGRSAEYLQPTRKGDPDAPLTDSDLNAKFLELAQPVLGEDKAVRLLDRIWSLENMPSIRSL